MASVGDGAVTDAHSCLTFLLCSQEELPMRWLTSDLNSMDKNAISATCRILKVQIVSKRNCLMHHSKAFREENTHIFGLSCSWHWNEFNTELHSLLQSFLRQYMQKLSRRESLFAATFICVLEGRGNIRIFFCGSN